jgi:hypothetical protein
VEIPREVLDRVADADGVVHARARELEKFVRALDSYDHDAYGRGRIVIGVTIALIIAIVLVVAL